MFYGKGQLKRFWKKEKERYIWLMEQSIAKSTVKKYKELVAICDTTLKELEGNN